MMSNPARTRSKWRKTNFNLPLTAAFLALGFGRALSEWGETLDIDIIVASQLSGPLE
jgi:hypothetical protein